MIFCAAFFLGMTFASAGGIAKTINSSFGAQIANRRVHEYLSWLGALSNLIFPVILVLIALLFKGMAGGGLAAAGVISGALGLGVMRLSYTTRLLFSVIGVPIGLAAFFLILLA